MAETIQQDGAAGEVRLNKYISASGLCSRREADQLIIAGRVQVDGAAATLGTRVRRGQNVTVDGRSIEKEQELILLAANKPRGVVCTTDQRWGDTTIYDILKYPKRVFSVGRLDKDSEGLLLLTNDGDLMDQIMRARNYHEKEYVVTVNRKVTQEFLRRMQDGIYLEELDVTTRRCRAWQTGEREFHLVLTQGLNRQIRRMCAACGYRVEQLVRVRIMNVLLGDLAPGEYRSVEGAEYQKLTALLANSQK